MRGVESAMKLMKMNSFFEKPYLFKCVVMVTDNPDTASTAARLVKITYTNVQPPVLTIKEAIEKKMFFPKQADDIVEGNAEGEKNIEHFFLNKH